jgi:hypothetical protein
MEKRNSLDVKNSLIAEEQNEEREKKKVEDTVQKWLSLQKTVKEEITLEENIISQQTEDFNKLKNYFNDFYELKISSRKIYEDIRRLKTSEEKKSNDKNKDNKEDNKEETDEGNNVYYIDSTIDKAIFQAWEPIRNLLFLFRNNYDYITQYVLLKDKPKLLYDLYGVISHIEKGSPNSYFVASCKSPVNNKWYRYNDALVNPINNLQREVIDFETPYILFYQKV